MGFHGMPKRMVCVDGVVVPAPDPGASQVPIVTEIGDDTLDSTFRDPDPGSDVSGPDGWVLVDTDQDMRMVGEEGPFGF
jgi:hypothetical protein